ncbi:MAG: DoxX family protein, partial [Planctomycetes bacterium]|nr:DoxX family protein [Planctomycetota bacterium]
MKISERIIRIILGAIFIVSGLLKIQDPLLFYGDILSFGIIAGQPALLAAYF